MGSACNNSVNNYFEKTIPDTGVKYTGPAIPELGICTGDLLSEVDAAILQKIINYATGVGISIPSIDLTTCGAFKDCIACCSTCTDLPCLLECYKNTICSIWTDVEELKVDVATLLSGPYNTGCLTSKLPTNPKLNQIVQELINEFCNLLAAFDVLNTTVAGFTSGIGNTIGNFLAGALKSCQTTGLTTTGSGSTFKASFQGFVPVGGIIPFGGSTIGKFDTTGRGLTGTDMCGWALCNGNNGTVDMREQVPVGAGAGIMGGGYLAPNASGANYGFSEYVGQASVLLTSAQSGTGAHSHSITDPGHSHRIAAGRDKGPNPGVFDGYAKDDGDSFLSNLDGQGPNGSIRWHIKNNTTGITGTNSYAGSNAIQAHENRQPSVSLYYIQRIY